MSSPASKRIRLSPPEPGPTANDATPQISQTSDTRSQEELELREDQVLPPDSRINSKDALQYWTSTPATVSGVLGGYPQLSKTDIQGSANFLAKVRRSLKQDTSTRLRRVVDCGAGIGRITEGLLQKVGERVDIVEPAGNFCDEIRRRAAEGKIGGLGTVWEVGLEDWTPFELSAPRPHTNGHANAAAPVERASGDVTKAVNGDASHDDPAATDSKTDRQLAPGSRTASATDNSYDLIWNQWCLGQLNDEQLVHYLGQSRHYLRSGGIIMVKENLSNLPTSEDIFDETDSSVTRTQEKFEAIFEQAGLSIIKTELQRGFPKGLYPVRIWALRPSQ